MKGRVVVSRFFANNAYNKARRFDWRPLRNEVFGKPNSDIVSPAPVAAVRPTTSFIPSREDGEVVERPATTLPVAPRASGDEIERQNKKYSFAAPEERKQKISEDGVASGVGRRKTAIAKAWLRAAKVDSLTINDRELPFYFALYPARELVLEPLLVTELLGQGVDVKVRVHGGGVSAQAGAVRLAIARALQNWDPELRWSLKLAGCLERDSRAVERKKTGKPKARRSKQWSKR